MKKYLSDFPDLVREFHIIKNGDLKPENFTYGSNKKVWWRCSKSNDHEWETSVKVRTTLKRNCPFCAGKKPSKTNNLETKFPKIAKEWHPTKNGDLTPSKITFSSTKKVWWICSKGHEYNHSVNQRTTRVKHCPYCSGYRLSKDNNLKAKFPKIAKEWHPTKNGKLVPEDFYSGSKKKVWFLCPKNHSYETRIQYRTGSMSGCPFCTNQTSSHELRIFAEIKFLFKDTLHKYKINNFEFDVYVPSLKLAIEYDGAYWHENKISQDKLKNNFCKIHKIKLIRIRQLPLKIISKNDILVAKKRSLDKNDINLIVKRIQSLIRTNVENNFERYLNCKTFCNEKFYQKYKSYLPSPPLENSLLKTHPDLISLWDFKKNYPLKPKNFSHGSSIKVNWICDKNHSYKKAIVGITRGERCPYCAGKKVDDTNSLLTHFPQIAKEWHPTKNGDMKPYDYAKFSHKKVWWQCKVNKEHEWEVSIASRTSKGTTGCPFCYKSKSSSNTHPSKLTSKT